jgi:hypothetical protein
MKLCIDCNKNVSVERKRCKECVVIYNRLRVKQYHKKDKPRYGIIKCDVCNENLIKGRPNQTKHGKCKTPRSIDYNKVERSNKGNTIARQVIIDYGFNLNYNLVIHHKDENPSNNSLSNLFILSRSNHAKLHRFLEKQRSLLEKSISSNLENCWNSLRDQLTTTWLETTNVNVIKITDIGQSAAEPLNIKSIYIFNTEEGSEAMYQVSGTDNAVDKDMVQTQINC